MNDIFFPFVLTALGFITAFSAYRGIRRGGARFYTLEREAILRRARLTLTMSVLLFLAAISVLVYERQPARSEETAAPGGSVNGAVTLTPTPFMEQFPPLATPTSTPDPSIPTPTATPAICRAVVESVNGLILRDAPGGQEIGILADGSILTLISSEPPADVNGIIWRKVRPVIGDEGWVSAAFIIIGAPCE